MNKLINTFIHLYHSFFTIAIMEKWYRVVFYLNMRICFSERIQNTSVGHYWKMHLINAVNINVKSSLRTYMPSVSHCFCLLCLSISFFNIFVTPFGLSLFQLKHQAHFLGDKASCCYGVSGQDMQTWDPLQFIVVKR